MSKVVATEDIDGNVTATLNGISVTVKTYASASGVVFYVEDSSRAFPVVVKALFGYDEFGDEGFKSLSNTGS